MGKYDGIVKWARVNKGIDLKPITDEYQKSKPDYFAECKNCDIYQDKNTCNIACNIGELKG